MSRDVPACGLGTQHPEHVAEVQPEGELRGERLFEPSVVRDVRGVRVGLVGLTSPIIPKMSPHFAAGLRFPDPHETLPRRVARLRHEQGAELVVAVSHLGFAQDVNLARAVDDLDVILSGHTHNRLTRPAQVGRTLIIQSGFSGSFLGRLDLEVRSGMIVGHRHELITLEEAIMPDPLVQAAVEQALAPFRSEMNEVVGHSATTLHRMGLLETTMDNLITDAYQALTGAEVALSHGWRFGPPVPAGPVTVGDLWAMVPTNPEVFTAELTGRELHALLEANMHGVLAADPNEQAGGYLLRTSGLSVVFRPNNGRGTRVEHLEVGGEVLDPERRYLVAAAGGQDLKQARHGKAARYRRSTPCAGTCREGSTSALNSPTASSSPSDLPDRDGVSPGNWALHGSAAPARQPRGRPARRRCPARSAPGRCGRGWP